MAAIASVRNAHTPRNTSFLPVPDEIRTSLAEAAHAGRTAAKHFSATHGPGDAWMFRAAVVKLGGYAPLADVERQELAFLHRLQESRTTAGIERAQVLDRVGSTSVWSDILQGSGLVAADKDRAARLLNDALTLGNDIAQTVKGASMRQRPFVVDPTLTPALRVPGNNPSFPSGHATAAFAAAEVLASFLPARRSELEQLAHEVAFSRLYAGMHFPSDTAAGARIGTMIAAYLVQPSAPQLAGQ